jgi:hypothetical protein
LGQQVCTPCLSTIGSLRTLAYSFLTDLYVAFISRAIPARLVDFPKVEKGAELVLRWVEQYFASPKFSTPAPQSPSQSKSNSFPMPNDSPSRRQNALSISDALRGASPVVCTERMPIVLQHDGHSRTIVGYEKCKDGSVNLLVFDPSQSAVSLIDLSD